MVHPQQHELALRCAEVEPDKDVVDAKQQEIRLVYGYYLKGHNLKIQADLGEISYGENFSTLSACGDAQPQSRPRGEQAPRRAAGHQAFGQAGARSAHIDVLIGDLPERHRAA
jgi:hypothetical protein